MHFLPHRCTMSPFLFLFSLFAISLLLPVPSLPIDSQGQALLSWKNSFNHSIPALSSWDPADSTPCKWTGVRCDSRANVLGIALNSVNLEGSLPSDLRALSSLQIVNLTAANLTGSIPNEFGRYAELVVVDLKDNDISGEIPDEICKLSKLEVLSLSGNSLSGSIPSCISRLTSLKELSLYDNTLSGEVPSSVGDLKLLEVFRVGGNKDIRGVIPPEIGGCSSLRMLGLAETSIFGRIPPAIGLLNKIQNIVIYTTLLSGAIPEEIGNCTELENLYLYQNSLSGSIPKAIGELTKLQSLFLWQNNLAGDMPNEIGQCTSLQLVDLSENLLTGKIPKSVGNLVNLEELHLSMNHLSGSIPKEIGDCAALRMLEVDNNQITGEIPASMGRLKNLNLFFAWMNNITGNIPDSLSDCRDLQSLDLSYNDLSGEIPNGIFHLQNLTKLLLISNKLSGSIPPDLGNCTNLFRLRLSDNQITGTIPPDFVNLKGLNFVDFSNNRLTGDIPLSISHCDQLEFLDFHSNEMTGEIPRVLPTSLQYLDISDNAITGSLPRTIGSLTELTKLNLENNQLSGEIPPEIASCSKLQLLNIGRNEFSGGIPTQVCRLPALAISLNLSYNKFTGVIPAEISGLAKLAVLDLSHNSFVGKLNVLGTLQNLVSLNISFNNFSGEIPDTPFFKRLPFDDIESNPGLNIPAVEAFSYPIVRKSHRKSPAKVLMLVLIVVCAVLVFLATCLTVRSRRARHLEEDQWELTLFQKMDLSINDVVESLTSTNVIGTGSSGVVYKVAITDGTVAVKKMWSSEENEAFTTEIRTLSSIRHRSIVRLLGWGANKNIKLLFYNYLPNGSLSTLIHAVGKGIEWETRYDIVLGVAHALAYLHHDCVPPILHGDVKSMNVLLGIKYEPHLADFGLARVLNGSSHQHRSHLAGSYGYMAPEHGSMERITEKSDVYSYGVVVLEVLTGRHPVDTALPGGVNLVEFVREMSKRGGDVAEVVDCKLRGRVEPAMNEIRQVMAVALLCVSRKADGRPSMNDVVAMLEEIRQDSDDTTGKGEAKGVSAQSFTASIDDTV